MFGYEKKLEDSMDLLLLIDDNKWHYVYIKDFNRFVFHKKKKKNQKWYCIDVFTENKEDRLNINGQQSVELEK